MCDCNLCKTMREDRMQLDKLPEESKIYFEKRINELYNLSDDNDYLSWKLKELSDENN